MNYALRYPRFWRGYFLFVCLMVVSNILYGVVADLGQIDVASLVFTVFALAGLWPLFGYVRQKRIAPRGLWVVVLLLDGVGLLGVLLALVAGAFQAASPAFALLAIAAFAIGAPNVLALYQYCFRSPHLWA